MNSAAFEALAALLKERSGLVVGRDKLYLLETRLAPILKRENLADLAALAARLRPGHRAQALERDVIEAMTTNESLFFRDAKPFTHFGEQALPMLDMARPPGVPLRIWSAAASSGQEAYSLAMVVAEKRSLLGARPVQIVGTDIARLQLARAREGLYSQFEIERGLPRQMLARYFLKEESGWRVHPALRALVEFREWNLLSDLRPLGRFDVVLCRNVLIYFDVATRARVLDAIVRQMTPDGLLYLGGSETLLGLTQAFRPLPGELGVYARALPLAASSPGGACPLMVPAAARCPAAGTFPANGMETETV